MRQHLSFFSRVSNTQRIDSLLILNPLFGCCSHIRRSLRHTCLLMGPQRAMLNSYPLPVEFKVNSNQMWSGPSEHEIFVLINGRSSKDNETFFEIFLQKNVQKVISNYIKVFFFHSRIPSRPGYHCAVIVPKFSSSDIHFKLIVFYSI